MLSIHQLIGALAFAVVVSAVAADDSAALQKRGQQATHSQCYTMTNGQAGKVAGKATLRQMSMSKRSESYLVRRHKKKHTAQAKTPVKSTTPKMGSPSTFNQVCGQAFKASDDAACLSEGWLSSNFTDNCKKNIKISSGGHSIYAVLLASCPTPMDEAGCNTITLSPSLYSKIGGGSSQATWQFTNGDEV